MQWQDLVALDDAGLEAKGVNALGARRKLLKVCCADCHFEMTTIAN